tara:strand:+ start:218 stop:337 length:120 start_codon:yes stop_codon:yes gene_type:complete
MGGTSQNEVMGVVNPQDHAIRFIQQRVGQELPDLRLEER